MVGLWVYEYEVNLCLVVDLLLFEMVFLGCDFDFIVFDFGEEGVDDLGILFKFNVSYQVIDDVLVYVIVSEGFCIGGVNGVVVCFLDIDEI